MTKPWFESILAPTRTQDWAGERLDCVSLAESENCYQPNPAVQQNKGFQGWLKMGRGSKTLFALTIPTA
jgi:hypothetical protein